MDLTVTLNDSGFAQGQLYWDNGIHIGECFWSHSKLKLIKPYQFILNYLNISNLSPCTPDLNS